MKKILGTSKSKEFRDFMRDQIKQGVYKPGDRIPPVRAFAGKYAINKTTVNSAILSLATEGLLVSYPGKGTFVVKPKKQKSTNIIGYIFDSGASREYPSIAFHIRHLTRKLAANHYSLVADEYPAEGGICENPDFQEKIRSHFFSGLIAYTSLSVEDIVFLKQNHVPLVIVGDESNDENTASVCADMFEAGMMLTEHLVNLGHKKIALLTGPAGNRAGELLALGYRAVMEKYDLRHGNFYVAQQVGRGVPAEPSDVPARNATHPPATLARSDCGLGSVAGGRAAHPEGSPYRSKAEKSCRLWRPCLIPGPWGEESGGISAEQIVNLKERPTAVIAVEEIMALGVMKKLLALGYRVPKDFAVVGMGNRLPVSAYPVPLTVSDTDEEAQIMNAADLLEDLIQGKNVSKKIKLSPKLIVRQSCGKMLKKR